MSRQPTESQRLDPAHALAGAIREAHLDLIREDNPHGIEPGNVPLAALGRHGGYLRLARRLIARGVKLTGG